METALTRDARIDVPIICGAMYPCSNVELIAAASEAGGIGIVQPLTLVHVFELPLREGFRRIRALTQRPIGMNLILEQSSKVYEERMRGYLDIAIESGVRFFVTALGNPTWVVERVHAAGGVVYHDVTNRKWADKGISAGVDGLICVNNRAGGHAGQKSPEELLRDLKPLGLPLVCAGGIGTPEDFRRAIDLGYAGAQLGTRFIATTECSSPSEYKTAIVSASEDDIVLTERVTGVPLAVIRTPYVDAVGTKAGPIARYMLQHRRFKKWARTWYALRSAMRFKRSVRSGVSTKDYLQAGKSVAGVHSIVSARDIVHDFARALESAPPSARVI